ncbi:MAG: COX15/CtaA family protein [Pseudomonadota bacterium]
MSLASIGADTVSEAQAPARVHVAVRVWLCVIGLMVISMVLVGGATRLTDSGLSITEWKPIHGVIPPLSAADWAEEFDKYRQIPEYQQINRGMSLEAFKFIYWWEWGHRLLGRTIGVAFAVPLAVFWFAGMLPGWLKPRLVFLLALGGFQGAVGWWMVTSGLVERTDVSQVRLAVHLSIAFLILAYTAWLFARLTPNLVGDAGRRFPAQPLAALFLAVLLIQGFLGGLVAGLDAGLAYNTWPLMADAFVPSGLWMMDPFWINHLDNVLTVQFQHRMMAYLLLALGSLVIWRVLSDGAQSNARHLALVTGVLLIAQALSGIVTLLTAVPLGWALVHQGLACVMIVAAVFLLCTLTPEQPARH